MGLLRWWWGQPWRKPWKLLSLLLALLGAGEHSRQVRPSHDSLNGRGLSAFSSHSPWKVLNLKNVEAILTK